MLIDKLDIVEKRYNEIYQMISDPKIIADQKKYIELSKELKDLKKLLDKGNDYKSAIASKKEAEDYLNDSSDKDMIDMAKDQLEESKQNILKLEDEIKILLIPKDPDDSKNVVMEIRAGTGGDEASIFAGDLYRMYTKFCQEMKWKTSLVDTSAGTAGGFKEIIFEISGEDVYNELAQILLAEIYDYILKDLTNAKIYYLSILKKFPKSIHYEQVRIRLKEIMDNPL